MEMVRPQPNSIQMQKQRNENAPLPTTPPSSLASGFREEKTGLREVTWPINDSSNQTVSVPAPMSSHIPGILGTSMNQMSTGTASSRSPLQHCKNKSKGTAHAPDPEIPYGLLSSTCDYPHLPFALTIKNFPLVMLRTPSL